MRLCDAKVPLESVDQADRVPGPSVRGAPNTLLARTLNGNPYAVVAGGHDPPRSYAATRWTARTAMPGALRRLVCGSAYMGPPARGGTVHGPMGWMRFISTLWSK